jgi:hypothetical protein
MRPGGRSSRAGDGGRAVRVLHQGDAGAADRVGQGAVLSRLRLPGGRPVRLAPVRKATFRSGHQARGRRPLPLARNPFQDASTLRRRRRHARGDRERAGPPRERPLDVRHRRRGEDRDRCVHLAPRQRRRPRRHLLGQAARAVDAQPGRRSTGPGRLPWHGGRDHGSRGQGNVPRRGVPPTRGGGRDVPDRSVGDAHHGEGPDPGTVGAGRVADHRARRQARTPSSR